MFTPTTVTSSLRPGNSWTIFLYYACWSFLIGENISIWMTPFRFESSCARDGGMWWIRFQRCGGPYLIVGVRGILLPWVIVRREGRHDHIWISNFVWRQFRGVGYALLWHMGRVCPYMGPSTPPWVFGVPKMCFILLLKYIGTEKNNNILIT